jgi:hypothetical protein
VTRSRKIAITLAAAGVLIVALQLWGPAPRECDGPCSGWEWGLIAGLVIFVVLVLLVSLGVGYAIWSIVKVRRRQ